MGLYKGLQNHEISACVAFLSAPRCRNFVVYPADKDHPSVLHMVGRRALVCNYLFISFCMNEIEGVEHFVMSSHFFSQNQHNAKIVPFYMPAQRQDKCHSIKHPSKMNRHIHSVLLHRELHLNLNRHVRHGRVLTNIGLWSRVHRQRRNVLGRLGPLRNG